MQGYKDAIGSTLRAHGLELGVGEWAKTGALMAAAWCPLYAGQGPKADRDMGECQGRLPRQSGAPAQVWRTNRRYPGEEVGKKKKGPFRQRKQHIQRQREKACD